MKVLVLGGGEQGSACAFDLARSPEVSAVTLADLDVSRPRRFLEPYVEARIRLRTLDASDDAALVAAMEGFDAVACALPYRFNLSAARAAVARGVHYCDLGGNTEIVNQQIELHDTAVERGISVVPDCGLAPGLVNVLAEAGMARLERTGTVRIYVGGLPKEPKPPLNYRLAYSLEGVLDYYTTPVLKLEGGRVVEREPLDELEAVDFGPPLGVLEAFLTAGGVSTMPYEYEGRVQSMTYKTLRYPGHAALMRAMRDLGLLSATPVDVAGCRVSPRRLFIRTVSPVLYDPESEDLVALRVLVEGEVHGRPTTVRYEMVDTFDREHGITAMMRTTGYSLAAVARLQASGRIAAGAHTAGACVPAEPYLDALEARGVRVRRSGD